MDLSALGGNPDGYGDRIIGFMAPHQNDTVPYAELNISKLEREVEHPEALRDIRANAGWHEWTLGQARARYLSGMIRPAEFAWFLIEHVRKYGKPTGFTDKIEIGKPGVYNKGKKRSVGAL